MTTITIIRPTNYTFVAGFIVFIGAYGLYIVLTDIWAHPRLAAFFGAVLGVGLVGFLASWEFHKIKTRKVY